MSQVKKQPEDKNKSSDFSSITKVWNQMAEVYSTMDSCPQTFFFTLVNQLKINKSLNILEIACGAGLLLPFVIDQKRSQAQYVATDISSQMIKNSEGRLKYHFSKYESKLQFAQWMKKQRVIIKEANGEEPIQEYGLFDTVICNLVLMLTLNPKNVLSSIYKTTTDDAKIGITIWGQKTRSNFITLTEKAIIELKLPLETKRSPFYYQGVIHQDLAETGWEVVFQWQQVGVYPFTAPEDIDPYITVATINAPMDSFSQQQKASIRDKVKELYIKDIQSHNPMLMSCKLMIVQKKK